MATLLDTPGKIAITPRELMGDELYTGLEKLLRQHLKTTGYPPGPGEYPALIFGASPTGLVAPIRLIEGS